MALHVLNDAEIAVLREVIEERKNRRQNTPSRPHMERSWDEGEDHQAPEVYVAYPVESSGIPALTRGSGSNPDEPGRAECDIYAIINEGDTPKLRQSAAHRRDVHNLSTEAISQDWLQVHRDKMGKWLAITGGGGITTYVIRFTITSMTPGSSRACVRIDATNVGVEIANAPRNDDDPCGGATGTATVGDEAEVVDPTGCLSLAVGQAGYAIWMQHYEGEVLVKQWEIIFLCCE